MNQVIDSPPRGHCSQVARQYIRQRFLFAHLLIIKALDIHIKMYIKFFFNIFCHCSLICLFSSVCLKSLFEDYVKWWEAKDVLTLPCYLGGSHRIIVADVNFNTIESEGLSSWVQLWFLPRCSTLSASFQKGKWWRPAASLFVLKVFSFHTYLFFASLSLLKFLKVFRCKSLNGIEWNIQLVYVGKHER